MQTIVGVGVLVLGTPFFLLLNFNIVDIMNLLLPISITTSLLNYIYLKSNKEKFRINLDKEIKKNFILIFLPGIFLGLFLIRNLINYINFEILVSIVIYASLLIKNAGFQIKTYAHESEPMPFEMILGVSSRFEHAPLRWSISWAHLEKWDLSYINPAESTVDPLTNEEIVNNYSTRDKFFSHLHVGGEFLFSENFNLRLGYNFRRRQEMALDLYKHNVGLSWGFSMKISKTITKFILLAVNFY